MTSHQFTTQEIKALSEQVFRIRLAPVNDKVFSYQAGQYLFLVMGENKKIPLSIASAPHEKNFLELHLRIIEENSLAGEMLALFKDSKQVEIEAPFGNCTLPNGHTPIIFIAGGTGFSPVKSLMETAFNQSPKRELALYVGAQNESEFYQSDIIANWKSQSFNFHYTPVINEMQDGWTGKIGFPHQSAIADYSDNIEHCDFFVCGSEPMVMNVYQSLLNAGAQANKIHSDILDIKRENGEID